MKSLAFLLLLMAQTTLAAEVTVNVRTAAGSGAEDAVVVFDPVDVNAPPTHDTARIDQINKQFDPKVTVLRTGTAVTFPNSDQIRHNVYSFSPAKTFTLQLYAGSPASPVTFDKPGLVVLGCNIHDNMLAFVAVVDSPYFAKVGRSGTVKFDLPRGHYGLRVWHPQLKAALPTRPVDVQNVPLTLSVSLDLQGHDPVAAWY